MDAKTWQQAKQWLIDAAALPDAERAAFLAKQCADESLRRELLEMLASDATLSGIVHAPTLSPGTRLGPYEIETVIGAGGMGEVYRARDRRLGRDVAIKVIPAAFATDGDRLARFDREAKLLAALNHPHICTLFDVGRDHGTDFIVMECVEGELLSDRLRKGPLSGDKALAYAIEIADALDKAHALGIVHRDLKPGNVMLTKSGTKLLDFGLARSTRTPSGNVTQTGMILGTLRYMSPEQLKGADADARSDVWAFGCVLYQMLTGRPPFERESEATIAAAILETEPSPLSTMARGSPPALQRVLDRCLAKAPDDRWQSLADLRHELEWIARPGGRTGNTRETGVGSSRRERIAWSVVAVAIAVAVAAVAFAVWTANRVALPEAMRLSMAMPDGIDQAGHFALSSDGRQLAFVGHPRDGSEPLVWIRPVAGDAEPQPLPKTAGVRQYPFWSPNGQSIGFFAAGKLKTIDVASGMLRELCDAPNARGGTWANHMILFAPLQGGILRVSDQGGEPSPVTVAPPQVWHRYPRFLSDGVHFLFTAVGNGFVSLDVGSLADAGITELYRAVSGDTRHDMTQAYVARGMLVFAPSGSVLAQTLDEKRWRLSGAPMLVVANVAADDGSSRSFAASDDMVIYRPALPVRGPARLTWISRNGELGMPLRTPGPLDLVRLSPDDTRAVTMRTDGSKPALYVMDLARDVTEPLTEGTTALWSPDGGRVLFRKPVGSFDEPIHSVLAAGGGEDRLETDRPDDVKWLLGWSASGSLLYGGLNKSSRADLWEKPSSGPAHILIPANTATVDFRDAAVTRAGDLIASAVGQTALYVQRIRGGAGATVTSGTRVLHPRWRADGRELYYLSAGHLWAVDVTSADPPRVGTPRALFEFNGSDFSPSRDGQRFLALVPQASTVASGIGVVLNWTRPVSR